MRGRCNEWDKGRFNENKSLVNSKLVEPELYQAYKGMAHTIIEVDENSFKDKISLMIILLGLVYGFGNIRGCKLFNNKL